MKKKKPYAVNIDKATPGIQKSFRSGMYQQGAGKVLKTGGRVAGLIGLAGLGFSKNKKKYAKMTLAGGAAQLGGYLLEKRGFDQSVKAAKGAMRQKQTWVKKRSRKK